MFTVTGYLPDGVAYTLVVEPDPGVRLDPNADTEGVVSGSGNVVDLLRVLTGREVHPTPTSQGYLVDLNDPESVLAALLGETQVVILDGDVPELHPDLPPEAVS